MTAFARRRRARFEKRVVTPEDPDNGWRARDCAAQMAVFDRLDEEARARIRDGVNDTDTFGTMCRIKRLGLTDRAKRALRERGRMPCELEIDQLVSLEILVAS